MKSKTIFILTLLFLAGTAEAQLTVKEQRELKRTYNTGVAYLQSMDYNGAVMAFDQSLALDSAFALAWMQRGRANAALGQVENALSDLERAIRFNEELGEAYFYLGYLMFGNDTTGMAEVYLQTSLDKGFETAEAYYCLGLNDLVSGKDDQALLHFNRAINRKDDYALAYHDRAGIKRTMGDYLGALYDYKAAVNYQPDFPLAYNNMGAVKMTLGDYEGAIGDFSMAIEQAPGLYLAYNNRGYAYYQLGDMDAALNDFYKALEYSPGLNEAQLNVSSALARQDRLGEAVELLDRVIGEHPQRGVLYLNRGLIREMQGDLVGACEDWNAALELGEQQASEFIKECK
jgi:tetratricopeptide (TPR) repeat protein